MAQLGAGLGFSCCKGFPLQKPKGFTILAATKVTSVRYIQCSNYRNRRSVPVGDNSIEEKLNKKKSGKKEHHLWMKRDSAESGHKALNLIHTVSKWMLSKGQGLTMGTYDTLLLAFDMDGRVDEAESLWNMIVHTHTRSVSRLLCSRMISLYHHHRMPDKIIEVFADMEELAVKPDEDTVRRVARAFQELGQEDKQKLVLKKYQCKWKYLHFNGERVKVRRDAWDG